MPRGMDERFEDPSEPSEEKEDDNEAASDSSRSRSGTQPRTEDVSSEDSESDVDELNICEDWDTTTIYVEPDLSEEMEITFTRLKKQLKREGYVVRKNEHFYRALFGIAFEEHREQTKERIRELAKQDSVN